MVIDSLGNRQAYYLLNKRFKTAFDWFKKAKSKKFNVGNYEIKGKEIFATISLYQTKNRRRAQWEAHKKYIDIHFVVKDSELIGYANINRLKIKKTYEGKGDYVLLSGDGDFLTLRKGFFAIFFPQDAHMPGVMDGKSDAVKKIVVKVRVK